MCKSAIFAPLNINKTIMTPLRIKQICKEKKMTLQELASIVGISLNSISGLATGKQKPSFKTLEKLSNALNVEVSELFAPKEDFIAFVRINGETQTFTRMCDLSSWIHGIDAAGSLNTEEA